MSALSYSGYRFPPDNIQRVAWMYLRFTLSFRDVAELLAERGIGVIYESIRGPAPRKEALHPYSSETPFLLSLSRPRARGHRAVHRRSQYGPTTRPPSCSGLIRRRLVRLAALGLDEDAPHLR